MNLIDKILEEWSYRVHDGMPNPKNPLHLVHLQETLSELRLPRKVSEKLLQNLRQIKEEPDNQSRASVLKKKILNPVTKNQIMVSTGLSYGSGHEAYPVAMAALKDAGWSDEEAEKISKGAQDAKSKKNTRENIDSIDGDAKDGLFKGETTAPGTVSSAINEIGTGYGLAILQENPNANQEEVMKAVQDIITEKGGPKLSQKHLQSIANSAKRENIRVNKHITDKNMSENTEISHVWGSKDSLESTATKLEELKGKGVTEVNGIEIDKYIEIVRGGGGGGDPTDTMIVLIDEDKKPPKVEILHTSNKMSNADIQANSGPGESIRKMDKHIEKSNLSEDEKVAAKEQTKAVRKLIKEKNAKISKTVGGQGNKFNRTMQDDKTVQTMITILEGDYQTEPFGISLRKGEKGKYWNKGVMTNAAVKNEMISKYGEGWKEKITDEDKLQMVKIYAKDLEKNSEYVKDGLTVKQVEQSKIDSIKDDEKRVKAQAKHKKRWSTKDDEPFQLTQNDQRILIAFGQNEDKLVGKKTEPEFDETEVEQLYRDQFNAMNNLRKNLNEKHNGIGDEMFKSEMIDRMHLNVAEGYNPGSRKDNPNTPDIDESSPGIPTSNFELNMGRNESSIKYDKNTGEMYEFTNKPKGSGKKEYKKIDSKTGKVILKGGEEVIGKQSDMQPGDIATIANPEIISGCITGKKPPLKKGTLQNNIKVDEKAYEDVTTGRQATYIVYDLAGNEICRQTVRSKTGLGGTAQDELKWSPDMQACMQRKSYLKSKGE